MVGTSLTLGVRPTGDLLASWSEPTLVFDGQAANFVAAGTPDGELTAVFADGVTYALRYIDGAWSEAAEISEDIGGLPQIAVSPSGTVAVMLDPYPDEIIELHSVAKGSSAWSTVEAGGNFPYRPSIAFAPSGDLVATWASAAPGDGGRREIALTRCR